MVAMEQLDSVFAALAHPTRRDILDRLTRGAMNAGDLAAPYPISGAAVSQHLRVLDRAGLIARTPRAQWREVSLRAEALDEVAEWVNRHRDEWMRRLDRLEARIDELNRNDEGNKQL